MAFRDESTICVPRSNTPYQGAWPQFGPRPRLGSPRGATWRAVRDSHHRHARLRGDSAVARACPLRLPGLPRRCVRRRTARGGAPARVQSALNCRPCLHGVCSVRPRPRQTPYIYRASVLVCPEWGRTPSRRGASCRGGVSKMWCLSYESPWLVPWNPLLPRVSGGMPGRSRETLARSSTHSLPESSAAVRAGDDVAGRLVPRRPDQAS